jgi:alanine racemase
MTLSATAVALKDGSVVVPLGYGDGISTRAAGRVRVAVDGVLVTVAEVGLDRMTLAGDTVRDGSRVVLFGSGGEGEWTLQQWADSTGTIGEEIVTRLGTSLPRRYLGA